MSAIITNYYGKQFDIEKLAFLFDQEVADSIQDVDNDQEWFDEYCKRHEEKFGETFVLDEQNPQF